MNPKSLTIKMCRERHPSIGRNRIYEAIASGHLSAVRVGRQFAIDIEALDAWVALGCAIEQKEQLR